MLNWFPPVGSGCPPEAELTSSHTSLGKRCHLGCCLDFLPGFHFSHNPFCPLQFTSPPELNSTPSMSLVANSNRSHRIRDKMPRLRHRLRCRRGSTRGRSSGRRRSLSTSSLSSSFESLHGRYPSMHSGHGNGRGCRLPSSPTRGVSASLSPPCSHPAASASLLSPSTAHFHFQCKTNRPLVIATITVTFKEIPEAFPEPSSLALPIHKTDPSDLV